MGQEVDERWPARLTTVACPVSCVDGTHTTRDGATGC